MKNKAINSQLLITEIASLRAQQHYGQALAEERVQSEKLGQIRRDQESAKGLAGRDFAHAHWAAGRAKVLAQRMERQLKAQAIAKAKLAEQRDLLSAAGRNEALWQHLKAEERIERQKVRSQREGAILDQLTVLSTLRGQRDRGPKFGE